MIWVVIILRGVEILRVRSHLLRIKPRKVLQVHLLEAGHVSLEPVVEIVENLLLGHFLSSDCVQKIKLHVLSPNHLLKTLLKFAVLLLVRALYCLTRPKCLANLFPCSGCLLTGLLKFRVDLLLVSQNVRNFGQVPDFIEVE